MKSWKIRACALTLSGLLLTALTISVPVSADGLYESEVASITSEEAIITEAQVQQIPAKSAVLMDAASGQILFEMNAHEKTPPASITKIMTMLLVMEALEEGKIGYQDKVTCSDHAAEQGGSQIWLEPGETMTVEELLKATAVNSANDASMALAEYVAGTEEAFVSQMNARASELGMANTCFQNPTGLDEDGHYSTAYDIALMSKELLKHEDITRFSTIWMDSLRGGETALTNTNKLVRFYEGCTGLKTGTTDGAGSCLAASAMRNDLHLIAVSMGSTTSDDRFSSCRTLLDYGFSAFESFTPHLDPAQLSAIAVQNGVHPFVSLIYEEIPSLLVAKGKADEIGCTVSIPDTISAPISEHQAVGKISYTLDGRLLAEVNVLAEHAVPLMTFGSAISLLWQALIRA
ncbi:MAG: D-alanyl-D-alanine carboxypeptidase family protein [Candidatus Merdivicinus sp.]